MSTWKARRAILVNICLFGVLYGMVSLNKKVLRPSFNDIPSMALVLGCFPNFIAAYIVGLFFVNGALTMRPARSRVLVYWGSLCVFAVLTVEELKPMWGASAYFDVLDIVASGVGSLLAIATYEMAAAFRKRAPACAPADRSTGSAGTPKLVSAEYVGQYRIRLGFADGCVGEVDLESELRGGVFEPLKDQDVFRAFRIDEELNTVAWPSGADFAPDFLYRQAARQGAAAGRARRGD
jgi:hypothetical protein